jgi:hypothetical protein
MLQASPPLLAKYSDLIATKGILGCYLQTELGHGTNVSRLETTATFIPKTQEFEIHSPTTTSSKWWIGGLGKTATHGVVQAKLILPGGKDLGPHLFFVQLRSMRKFFLLSDSCHIYPDFTKMTTRCFLGLKLEILVTFFYRVLEYTQLTTCSRSKSTCWFLPNGPRLCAFRSCSNTQRTYALKICSSDQRW